MAQDPIDIGPIADRPIPWHVTSFLEDANLAGAAIFVIDFEPDGTAWVAASDGLYRHDGYRWYRYTADHGLPSNYVRCVRVTRGGDLWVGTDRGAGVFDGKTFDPRDSQDNLAGPSVRRIVEDPDGTLWFACDRWPPGDVRAGLTRYRNGVWKSWRAEDGLPSDYVSDIFLDSRGHHFILTRNGLARFDTAGRLDRPIEEAGLAQCRDYLWSMVETPDGELLVTTDDWICVRKDGNWRAVPNDGSQIVRGQLAATRDGTVLACGKELGATFFEWKNGGFVPIWSSQLHTDLSVQYITEAPDGSIWVGGNGLLARWERSGSEWLSYEDLPPPQLRDADGGVWFANRGRVLRLADDRWTRFPGASIPLVRDSANGVWMSTGSGLARWDRDGVEQFSASTVGVTNPRHAGLDGAGNLWVVGECPDGRECVTWYDGETWTGYELADMKPSESVVFGAPGAGPGMWYVLEDSEADRFRLLHVDEAEVADVPLPIPAARYWAPRVLADNAGKLWLYGKMGLYRKDLDADRTEWRQITELPGKQVTSAVELRDEIWFSYMGITGGSGGVTRLHDGTWSHTSIATPYITRGDAADKIVFAHSGGVSTVTYGSADAPQLLAVPEAIRFTAVVPGPDDDLWFGTDEAALHYHPDGIPPETVIVHGGDEVRDNEDLVLQVRGVERFKPSSRSAHFNVAVQLDDRPWGEFRPLSDGRVAIGAAATGDHVVRVRVQDQGGDIDPTPAEWHFRTHPVPLQDRGWFLPALGAVVLTFLILAGGIIITSRREMRQRRMKQELEHEILGISEREQRRIGRDLHDGLGQRLTAISFQCHGLRKSLSHDAPSSSERLKEIEGAVRDTIADTRVLAHALYPADLDREDLETVIGNLVSAADRGFDGTCTYHHRWTPNGLSRTDKLNVYRIVQEALSNAMRHADANTIDVELSGDDGHWFVEVRDNGRGFDAEHASGGVGLRIMRYRADQLGGSLVIDSRPARGATVRCEVRIDR
jgi:ligand-binding sensor domain-containing protein/two-component sensor histidine kinase